MCKVSNPRKMNTIMMIIIGLFFVESFRFVTAAPTPLPFPFGNITNDTFVSLGDENVSPYLALPRPLSFFSDNVTFVLQSNNGYLQFYYGNEGSFERSWFVNVYASDIDTINGDVDQNQVSIRVGNNAADLNLARDIIAGNGTIFNPKAIIVATWYKVERWPRLADLQNTFQLIMPYSNTGEIWAIFVYSQLQYYSNAFRSRAFVDIKDRNFQPVQTFFEIGSNETMLELLNGTNCNRSGIYVVRINQGGPTNAPTDAPSKAPTAAPSNSPTLAPTAAPSKTPTKAPMIAPSEPCGLFGLSLICPGRHPVWFLLTLAGLVPTILFILVHL